MESGTPPPADLADTPTFTAFRQLSIPDDGRTHSLILYREREGRRFQYYLLANGHRIRPFDEEARTDEIKALAWFDDIFRLYWERHIRTSGPFD